MQFYVIAAKLRIILQFGYKTAHKPALPLNANDYTPPSAPLREVSRRNSCSNHGGNCQ